MNSSDNFPSSKSAPKEDLADAISSISSSAVVVTGALGFIGSALVWELNKAGFKDVLCVDSVRESERPPYLKKRSVTKLYGRDEIFDALNTPVIRDRISWVFHMGANSSTTETNWDHLYENNFQYTLRLFEWCRQHKKSLIYASSAATYGAGELGYSDELDSEQLKPLNLYGKSKVIFDQWALRQGQCPPNWYGLKFFNVYGPNENHKDAQSSVVLKSFHQIKETKHLKLFKSYNPQFLDGEQMRDFVYVKDLTRWMVELMIKKPASGLYNMGFGSARTWKDLGKSAFNALQVPENIQYIDMPESLKNQYQYYTKAEMSKWLKAGMSAPRWSLEEGTKDYIQNYLLQTDPYL